MATRVAVLLLLALSAAAVQAQSSKPAATTDFTGALEKNGFKSAAALFDIANLSGPLSKPSAEYTVLVPTDAAIEAFLKQMGLTVDGLKKRPLLAKQLAAQHLILKANVRPQELFANGTARIVATAAGEPNDLLFTQAGTAVKVADIHGNTANVQKLFIIDDKKTAHPIDNVLMPDTVFFSFADLCAFRPLTLKKFCNAAVYAGLNSTLNGGKLDATVFVPNSRAFVKAVDLSGGNIPTPAATADVLKYHIVSGYKTLGHGLATSIMADTPEQTMLAGQTLKVNYERVDPAAGDKMLPYAKAFVTSTSGNKAEVLRANVHVGTAVAHGVNAVLLPGKAAAAATMPAAAGAANATKPAAAEAAAATKPAPADAAAATKPAAAATKPAAAAAAPMKPAVADPMKPAAAATKPAAAAAAQPAAAAPMKPVVAAPMKPAGRRLLDFGWAASAGPTAEDDAATAAIAAAANGQEEVNMAAQGSRVGAEELSIPGDYAQVDDGLNWW